MMQSKRQQQPLQGSVDKGSQNRGGGGGTGDPYSEGVDSRLDHRPYYRQNQGDDHGPEDHNHRHEALAVKEGQGVGQLPVVVVFVVDDSAGETRDNPHKDAHIQGRSAQDRGKVTVHGDFLSEKRAGDGSFRLQHLICNAKKGAGDHIDQDKGNDSRESPARPLFSPGAADGCGKENVQVVDDGPSDGFHGAADGQKK